MHSNPRTVLRARDRAGNGCRCGGATLQFTVGGCPVIETRVTDNCDGSYTLEWRCPEAGGPHSASVLLEGQHVDGSPTSLTVTPRMESADAPQQSVDSQTKRRDVRVVELE